MTCDELEQLLMDAPRGARVVDACLDRVALDHVARCPRCAERVRERARVAGALRLLAEADADRGAPARVEAAAQAAWRARHESVTPVAVPVPVRGATLGRMPVQVPTLGRVPVSAATSRRARWTTGRRGALAAAAAAALAAVAIASLALSVTRRSPAGPAAPALQGRDVQQAHAQQTPTRQTLPQQRPPQQAETELAPAQRAGSRRSIASVARRGTRVASTTAGAGADPDDVVVFVPIPYAEPLRPTEMRQVVRVAVPPATVMLAGLSTQGLSDRFPSSVLADVLVGEDGVARGIRLVRQDVKRDEM